MVSPHWEVTVIYVAISRSMGPSRLPGWMTLRCQIPPFPCIGQWSPGERGEKDGSGQKKIPVFDLDQRQGFPFIYPPVICPVPFSAGEQQAGTLQSGLLASGHDVPAAPSRRFGSDMIAAFRPGYSGGSATVFHRLPSARVNAATAFRSLRLIHKPMAEKGLLTAALIFMTTARSVPGVRSLPFHGRPTAGFLHYLTLNPYFLKICAAGADLTKARNAAASGLFFTMATG